MFWLKTDEKMLYIYDGSGFVSARPDGLLIGDGLAAAGYVAPPVSTIPTATYSTGTPGQFTADDDYIYFCVAPNTWIKTVIVPFDEATQVLEIE